MKQFKLERVRYKNIMSVGQKVIDIDLCSNHKTLITGKNGGGKSTMLEAITFGLFGKPFRDIKKGQLINSFNKKDLVVEVWLSYAGSSFYIKRGQKPNILEIERNGVKLEETSSVKDFQEYFEGLIGMNYASFKQVVVLGTAGYTPFMQLSTPNRRKLVEDLLEVSVLAEIDKLNKTAIREVNQNISVLDMKKDHITTEINTHKEYAEKQRKMSSENLGRLEEMYGDTVSEAKSSKAELDSLKTKLAELVSPENPSEQISKMNSEISSLDTQIGTFSRVTKLYESGGECPTCKQNLVYSDKVNGIIVEQNELTSRRCRIIKDRVKYDNLMSEYNTATRERQALQSQLNSLKDKVVSSTEKAKKIKLAIEKSQQEFVDNSDKIMALQQDLDKVLEEKSNLVMEKYNRAIITEMLKDSGIKGSIVKKYIPLFNKKINHYLKLLEADYVFTLDEEFSESIKSRGREEFSYASFSQGEKGRIDIALLFTWRDIAEMVSGVRISCLFMDEVTDTAGLDAQGFRNLSIILDKMADFNFFIISHRDQDTSKYDAHIQMKKVGRFTVVE